jgi:hypothetical protein
MSYKNVMLSSALSFTVYELKKLVRVVMRNASDLSESRAVVSFLWFSTIAPDK